MLRQPPTAALAEILARDAEAGIDVFEQGPPLEPGPATQLQPLERPVFPAPDWRAEERAARARQNAGLPDASPPPEKSLAAYPAPKGRKPAATPNLDAIKAWKDSR